MSSYETATGPPRAAHGSPLLQELAPRLNPQTVALIERRRASARARRGWLVARTLALADIAGLTFAFVVSMLVFGGRSASVDRVGDDLELLVFFSTLPLWIVVASVQGLYDADQERADHSTADELVGVFHLVTLGSWAMFAGATFVDVADPNVLRIVLFWLLAIVAVATARALMRSLCRRSLAFLQNTVIVGAGEVGQLVARKFLQHQEYGLNVVGFVDAEPRELRTELDGVPLLGPPDQLPQIVRELAVDRVVVAFSSQSHESTLDLIRSLNGLDVQIDIVPRLFEVLGTNVEFHTAEGLPLIGLPPLRLSRTAMLAKRTTDLVLAGAGLAVLAPLFAAVAVAIKLDSRGPVFFRQTRRGTGETTFEIFKFRTMVADADDRKAEVAALNKHLNGGDPRMFKVPNDPRTTGVGRFLRRYSIDELPQLLNVVRGEMSLVGPRPLILDEDQHVVAWRRRRLELRPGITGLWQVLGRDDIPFEEMVRLDYLYVTTWSLLNDLKLVLRTFPVLFRARAT